MVPSNLSDAQPAPLLFAAPYGLEKESTFRIHASAIGAGLDPTSMLRAGSPWCTGSGVRKSVYAVQAPTEDGCLLVRLTRPGG